MNYTSSGDQNDMYQVNDNSTTIRWKDLQRHINDTLKQYTGATECYYNTLPVSGKEPVSPVKKTTENESDDTGTVPTSNSIPTKSIPNSPATSPTQIQTPSVGGGSDSLINNNNNVDSSTTSSTTHPTNNTDLVISTSWGSGFGAGIATSIVLGFLLWWYQFRKQRRLRSQYSHPQLFQSNLHHPPSSLQLNEYSDVDDTATIATSNRGRTKRNIDII
jgi:hypothetical protein